MERENLEQLKGEERPGSLGYKSQFDGGFQALHPDKPLAGRALTAQYMPLRPDMIRAITVERKAEGRVWK